MNDIETDMLSLAYTREVDDLPNKPPIAMRIGASEAFLLLATIQMAQTHPGHNDGSRAAMEVLGREIQAIIAPKGSALNIVMERAWNAEKDMFVSVDTRDPMLPTFTRVEKPKEERP